MFDNYQIFDKYSKFLEQWRAKGRPKLYVATMDIRKCYDSVDIKRLINMISMENFFEEQYIVHQFIKVIRSKRYLFSKNLDAPPEGAGSQQGPQEERPEAPFISKQKREKFAKRGRL